MEEMLKDKLMPDEEILWRGKAEPFETLDQTHRKKYVTDLILGAAVAFLLIGLYVLAVLKGGAAFMLFLPIVVLVLCGIPAINILRDASKIRKMEYFATNDRLIVLSDHVRSMDYSSIKEAEFRADSDGHVSLLCGKEALEAKQDKWRECTVVGQGSMVDEGECVRFVLYAPEKLDELKAVLKDRVPALS